jgi:hypothetical protein
VFVELHKNVHGQRTPVLINTDHVVRMVPTWDGHTDIYMAGASDSLTVSEDLGEVVDLWQAAGVEVARLDSSDD